MFKNLLSKLGVRQTEPEVEPKAHPRVSVDQPSKITIRLVPDNEFKNYELFLTMALLFIPIATSFTTAIFSIDSSKESTDLGRNSLIFSAIAFWFTGLLFLALALGLRRKMFGNKVVRRSISLGEFKSEGKEQDSEYNLGIEQEVKSRRTDKLK